MIGEVDKKIKRISEKGITLIEGLGCNSNYWDWICCCISNGSVFG
jgi:hypothetical protein